MLKKIVASLLLSSLAMFAGLKVASAEPVFILTPTTTDVSVNVNGTVSAVYLITNNSPQAFSEVAVTQIPPSDVASVEVVLSEDPNACPSLTFPLAPGQSCSVGFNITGLADGHYTLAPEVCQINPKVYCSKPSTANQISVTVGGSSNEDNIWFGSVIPYTILSLVEWNGVLYAGTSGKGVFQLNSAGTAWSLVANGGPGNGMILSMVVFNDTLYVGTSESIVYKLSEDRSSWIEVGVSGPLSGNTNSLVGFNASLSGNPDSLVVFNDVLYAGVRNGIADEGNVYQLSEDETSWALVGSGITGDPGVFVLLVFDDALYAGTNGDGVYRWNNDGSTWEQVGGGVPSSGIVLSLGVSNDGHLLAGTRGGVWELSDNGNSWNSTGTGIAAGEFIVSLAVFDGMQYAAGDTNGIYVRDGSSWTLAVAEPVDRAMIATDTGLLYGGLSGGVQKSQGESKVQEVGVNVPGGQVAALFVFDGGARAQLYAGIRDSDSADNTGVAQLRPERGGDDGKNGVLWGPVGGNLAGNGDVRSLGFYQNMLIAGTTDSGVFSINMSSSSVDNWMQLGDVPGSGIINSLAVYNGSLYAAEGGGGSGNVYQLDDSNTTWSAVGSFPGGPFTLAVINNVLYAGGSSGLVSQLNDSSWTVIGSGLPAGKAITSLIHYKNALYAGTQGVYQYNTGDNTWSAVGTGLPTGLSDIVSSLVVDGNILYASLSTGAVYQLSADGTVWTAVGNTGPSGILSMAVYQSELYVGTFEEGSWFLKPAPQ